MKLPIFTPLQTNTSCFYTTTNTVWQIRTCLTCITLTKQMSSNGTKKKRFAVSEKENIFFECDSSSFRYFISKTTNCSNVPGLPVEGKNAVLQNSQQESAKCEHTCVDVEIIDQKEAMSTCIQIFWKCIFFSALWIFYSDPNSTLAHKDWGFF